MYIKWYKSESNIEPQKIDTEISNNYIYLRRNITETERTNEFAKEPEIIYEYEEAKLTKEEYQIYLEEITSEENIKQVEEIKNENAILIEEISVMKNENEMMMEQLNMLTDCILEMSMLLYA